MIKVLQIVDSMGMGGIQTFIMNVYRLIDRDKIQFDFLLHHRLDNSYEEEVLNLGAKLYFIPSRGSGYFKNYRALDDFFSYHSEYDIVHFHESSLSYITPLALAKKHGVKKIIIHSHSSNTNAGKMHLLLHSINKHRISNIANAYIACGEQAKEWMFSKTKAYDLVKIITNGIDLSKFEYDLITREKIREEFGIDENTFVIGNVGRFNSVKNHCFLIKIFYELLKIKRDCKLLLVGDGELRDEITQMVDDFGIRMNVIFAGVRDDVNVLYQAMDSFVLPSLYEGFPVTAVEAQAAGLPSVLSDTITKEVLIKKNVLMCSLCEDPSEWAREILSNNDRIIDNQELENRGLSIEKTVQKLMSVYFE